MVRLGLHSAHLAQQGLSTLLAGRSLALEPLVGGLDVLDAEFTLFLQPVLGLFER